jgi:hypothetical protein
MIKKVLIGLALALLLGMSPLLAQKVEITPFGGYQMGGSFEVLEGKLRIRDNWNFGVILDFTLMPGFQIELIYSHQDSELRLKQPLLEPIYLFDAAVEYFHIGALRELKGGKVRPFATGTIGFTHFNPKPAGLSSEWRFSGNIGLGVKVLPSERIGLRLQGRLMLPFISEGAGFFVGPGGGYVTVSGEILVQWDVSAGLILRF